MRFGLLGLGQWDFASKQLGKVDKTLVAMQHARAAIDRASNDMERKRATQQLAELAVKFHAETGALCMHENGTTGGTIQGDGGRRRW